MSRVVVSLALPSNKTAPRRARAALEDVPEIESVGEDAKLVASELMSNAVRHSGATEDDLLMMRVLLDRQSVKIMVYDPGRSDQAPRVRPENDVQAGGVGLLLVSRIARRWAAERPDGCVVWAELALAA